MGIKESSTSPLYLRWIGWQGQSYGVRTVGLGWYFYSVEGNVLRLLTGFEEAKRDGLYTLAYQTEKTSPMSNAESSLSQNLSFQTFLIHSSTFVQMMGEWDRNFISIPLLLQLPKPSDEECETPKITARLLFLTGPLLRC